MRIYEQKKRQKKKKNPPMKNITINFPEIYDENIQKLIRMERVASRSECIRLALRDFLNEEYNKNLELLGYFEFNQKKIIKN